MMKPLVHLHSLRRWRPRRRSRAVSFRGMTRMNRAPVSNEVLKVKLPRPVDRQLSNGLRLLILESHRAPTVTLTISIPSSPLRDPAGMPGVAEATASHDDDGYHHANGAADFRSAGRYRRHRLVQRGRRRRRGPRRRRRRWGWWRDHFRERAVREFRRGAGHLERRSAASVLPGRRIRKVEDPAAQRHRTASHHAHGIWRRRC